LGSLHSPSGNPLRFASMGQLLHLKGFHLGLMAFAKLAEEMRNSEYWVIGDGPERKRLERLAGELGIAERVRFWGTLPRGEALQKLADCDILMHPSLHDSGGWVIAEAMAAGRPVICLNLGGPALQVTEETGFKISPQSLEQTIQALSQAMIKLARSPELRRNLGTAARNRAAGHFSWTVRGGQMQEIYTEICERKF
jgi:glycosyltransferase involved in cell wall biosynthesis